MTTHAFAGASPYRPGLWTLRSLGDVSVAPDPGRPLRARVARAGRPLAGRGRPRPASARSQRAAGRPSSGSSPGGCAAPDGRAFSRSATWSPSGAVPVAQAYAGHQFGGYRSASGRRPRAVARRTRDGRRASSRPAPQGLGADTVRAGRRRSRRGRPDAARVHRQRGHARDGHPDHPVAGGGRDGAHRATRDAAAGRRAGPYREQPPAGRHLPVRGGRRRRGRCCGAWPITPSPATTRMRPTPTIPISRCSTPWVPRRRR